MRACLDSLVAYCRKTSANQLSAGKTMARVSDGVWHKQLSRLTANETTTCAERKLIHSRVLFTFRRKLKALWNRRLASLIRTYALETPWRGSRTTNIGS